MHLQAARPRCTICGAVRALRLTLRAMTRQACLQQDDFHLLVLELIRELLLGALLRSRVCACREEREGLAIERRSMHPETLL